MEQYTIKKTSINVLRWDGTDADPVLERLHQAGWDTFVQAPDTDTIPYWNWDFDGPDDPEKTDIPCPSRLVIVGPYRGQLFQLDSNKVLTWEPGAKTFGTQYDNADLIERWDATGDNTPVPTPDMLR